MKQLYPSWRYHRGGASQQVANAAEHDALVADAPEDWADTPAAFHPPQGVFFGEPAPGTEPEATRRDDTTPVATPKRKR